MQRDLMVINLGEAQVQLAEIIKKFKSDDYDVIDFQHDIEHMMTHINTAYNIRNWDKKKIESDYNKSFNDLIQVPENKYLIE